MGGCIPEELVSEILLKLPIKSITRFQLVCINWKTLIESYSHSDQLKSSSNSFSSSLPSFIVFGPENSIFSLNLNLHKTNKFTPLFNHEFMSSSFSTAEDCYRPLGSSNGLVCLYVRATKAIYIWNPTTNVARCVGYPRVTLDTYTIVRSGFGFVTSINDYKIVMVVGKSRWDVYEAEIHVHSLKNNNWTSLDTSSIHLKDLSVKDIMYTNHYRSINVDDSIVMNDALHWILGPRSDEYHIDEDKKRYSYFIIRFDMVKEIFEKISDKSRVVSDMWNNRMGRIEASIGVTKSNKICVCQIYPSYPQGPRSIEIWVLEEYGAWDSWKKAVYVPGNWCYPETHHCLLKIIVGGKVVIMLKYSMDVNYMLLLDGRQRPPSFVELHNEVPAHYNNGVLDATYLVTYTHTWISPYSF